MIGTLRLKIAEFTTEGANLHSWEAEFKRYEPDTMITVLIREGHHSTAKWMEQNGDELSIKSSDAYFDTLGLYSREYSLNYLISHDWLIRYPDDGFNLLGQ